MDLDRFQADPECRAHQVTTPLLTDLAKAATTATKLNESQEVCDKGVNRYTHFKCYFEPKHFELIPSTEPRRGQGGVRKRPTVRYGNL
jgi:hypothetical protein